MKFERIYINGSSLSCGGSLEVGSEFYKYYTQNLEQKKWKSEKEVSYGNLLSTKLDVECVNDSKQGGGLDRLIRKTFDYIDTLSESEISSTLFLFDIPLQPNRMELYSKEFQDYLVVSVYNKIYPIEVENKIINSKISFSRAYTKKEYNLNYDDYFKHNEKINMFVDEYYDFEVEITRMVRQLILFYNFLDNKKINYNIDLNDSLFTASGYDKNSLILYKNNYSHKLNPNIIEIPTIWELSVKQGWRICDEISDTTDSHLGYFGNQKYSEFIYNKLKEKNLV
jgi:hypothetical protein